MSMFVAGGLPAYRGRRQKKREPPHVWVKVRRVWIRSPRLRVSSTGTAPILSELATIRQKTLRAKSAYLKSTSGQAFSHSILVCTPGELKFALYTGMKSSTRNGSMSYGTFETRVSERKCVWPYVQDPRAYFGGLCHV